MCEDTKNQEKRKRTPNLTENFSFISLLVSRKIGHDFIYSYTCLPNFSCTNNPAQKRSGEMCVKQKPCLRFSNTSKD
jgi:hypothetical protein